MDTIRSAEIVAVGTELLLGQTVNTNASYLAMQLAEIGIFSYYQTVVGDNPNRMRAQIEIAARRSDCVLITGGLGPTKDDISMTIAVEVAGKKLIQHEPSRRALEDYFKKRGRTNVTDNNWKQTLMPEDGIVLPNSKGTAPGVILPCVFEGHKTVLILLPGPPSELQPMFKKNVRPYLEARADQKLRNQYIRMFGIGESAAEAAIQDLVDSQTNPTIASYVAGGDVMFRITQQISNENEPDLNGPVIEAIKERLSDYIFEIGQRSMAEVVVDLLRDAGRTVSFAESCTGGLLAASITDIAGSSAVFKGGIVAYDNSVKMQLLRVSEQILQSEGAVSAACAEAMATGCRDVMNTDYAVSVTGIAGPDGGTEQKPVGLVYLAIADSQGVESVELNLFGDRERIRQGAVRQAQNMLWRRLSA